MVGDQREELNEVIAHRHLYVPLDFGKWKHYPAAKAAQNLVPSGCKLIQTY